MVWVAEGPSSNVGNLHNPWITLEEWLGWYDGIVKECGLDALADLEAARLLDSMVRGKALDVMQAERTLSGRFSLVFGAGPSLEADVKKFAEFPHKEEFAVLAADGATTALLKHGIIPDVVVTDLDGPIEDLLRAYALGSMLVVHAHGDNISRLESFLSLVDCRVLPTTQTEPFGCLYNFGGFTDGDRTAFLCSSVGVRAIVLAGMDLGEEVGPYSKPVGLLTPERLRIKRKKLRIAKMLLEWLAKKARVRMYNLTSYGVELRGIRRLNSFGELSRVE